jgi:hypothetical protein
VENPEPTETEKELSHSPRQAEEDGMRGPNRDDDVPEAEDPDAD